MILTVEAAPPAPTVDVTINARGSFGRDGSATISGTITCTGSGISFDGVLGQVQQRAGRVLISSFFIGQGDGVCDGTPHDWVATAPADQRPLQGRAGHRQHPGSGVQRQRMRERERLRKRQAQRHEALTLRREW
jgi:hypothetical protein